ncbi:MAG TPA: hypothetical protein H9880_03690 [Candidatus Anaerobutyricum avicola]|nr:hypothetical protein [Candidatus Anaerobutyricum avicola]
MRKRGYAMIMTAAMVLALGMPMMKGEAVTVPEMNMNVSEKIMPRYEEINKLTALFDISGKTANLKLVVGAPASKKVSLKMILQRKDGDSWTKVQTWSKAGTGSQTLAKSMVVTTGRKYRMKYTVTVGSETITDKTAAKTA